MSLVEWKIIVLFRFLSLITGDDLFIFKFLSIINLLGEKLSKPLILQDNFDLSALAVLDEIKIESKLYLKIWDTSLECWFVINLFFEDIKKSLEHAILSAIKGFLYILCWK